MQARRTASVATRMIDFSLQNQTETGDCWCACEELLHQGQFSAVIMRLSESHNTGWQLFLWKQAISQPRNLALLPYNYEVVYVNFCVDCERDSAVPLHCCIHRCPRVWSGGRFSPCGNLDGSYWWQCEWQWTRNMKGECTAFLMINLRFNSPEYTTWN